VFKDMSVFQNRNDSYADPDWDPVFWVKADRNHDQDQDHDREHDHNYFKHQDYAHKLIIRISIRIVI
jgi:hypothetical protein